MYNFMKHAHSLTICAKIVCIFTFFKTFISFLFYLFSAESVFLLSFL